MELWLPCFLVSRNWDCYKSEIHQDKSFQSTSKKENQAGSKKVLLKFPHPSNLSRIFAYRTITLHSLSLNQLLVSAKIHILLYWQVNQSTIFCILLKRLFPLWKVNENVFHAICLIFSSCAYSHIFDSIISGTVRCESQAFFSYSFAERKKKKNKEIG